ncbi:MAG: phosphodiester glycosidase family protein [Clostridiaceae bacterium]
MENRNQKPQLQYDDSYNRNRRPSVGDGYTRSGQGGGRYQQPSPKPRIPVLVIDIAIAALIMLVFYITNYAIHPKSTGSPLSSQPVAAAADQATTTNAGNEDNAAQPESPAQTDNAAQTDSAGAATPAPQAADATPWREKFADKFTTGAVEKTDTSYKDANINISIEKVQQNEVTYFFADIYVADIQYFKTSFAEQADVMGGRDATADIAARSNAILAINGDLCVDNSGPVVRNSKLYRDEKFADALVMNNDGSMQTFSAEQLDMNAIKTNGAWQVWTFGPMLLKDGQPMTDFNSTLKKANPRTAVGYYEPGHYCFLVVDGRQEGYSVGLSLTDMSQLFYDRGCKVAFNLDGGQSSEMVFLGKLVNQPYNGGRSSSDILYIG